VDRDSGLLGVDNEREIPMEVDHFGICKFSGPKDHNFKRVADHLIRMAESMS
jgi:hypothetical protein